MERVQLGRGREGQYRKDGERETNRIGCLEEKKEWVYVIFYTPKSHITHLSVCVDIYIM